MVTTCSRLAGKRSTRLHALLILLLGCGTAGQANRTIVIDPFTTVLMGDANAGDTVPLPFPVNYGAGAQTSVIVNLEPVTFSTVGSGVFAVPAISSTVGLSFTNSPADQLFAGLTYVRQGLDDPMFSGPPAAGVFLNNCTPSTCAPPQAPPPTSGFDFSLFQSSVDSSSYPFGNASHLAYYYDATHAGSADFQFFDLSGSGAAGDFGLLLQCPSTTSLNGPVGCTNIGFNLNGVTFSSSASTPPPAQYVSSCPPGATSCDSSHSWYFVFRNSAAVPEPSTWTSMLLGFALIGGAIRRRSRGGAHLRRAHAELQQVRPT